MPTLLKNKSNSPKKLGPIRGSIILLILKLIVAVFIIDAIVFISSSFNSIFIDIQAPFYNLFSIILILSQPIVNTIRIVIIIYFVLSWSHTSYYIDGEHLIVHKGVLNIEEDTYELATIRSADVKQSLLQRIFNFGDVELKTSASGGYQVLVILKGIANPVEFERKIRKYF
ncbi:MAG: hypothetical protein US96_C0011G0021 [Candidatus Woesebacteria bacterium GW2011_GWB1_38_5b]|uniref:YdbS-like PH domain-containing protein n=1 Tax=Candidatus Woesebacteria bacterium GW2011_GWB1_38_5b TaxID=1618569 RepID=A0A0G0K6V4_9BACT|nr:MAG: hypothetical protein US96_C0011G0021 [Candidatus Woesebacteria bacterium GW2011_GWB1_38_5b]